MTLEVEVKCPLDETRRVLDQLADIGARPEQPLEQQDLYFAHPGRDFAQTDEALRIRRVGTANFVTYKGPVLDPTTKTRHEIEIGLTDGAAAAAEFTEMLELLGFRAVRVVEKTRTPYRLEWEGRELELALDYVAGLGHFLEIEGLAEEADKDAVRDSILRLAAKLQLDRFERRSYLRLLIEKNEG